MAKMPNIQGPDRDKPVCFNPEKNCTGQECEFARGHFDRVNDALSDIFNQDAFTRAAVEYAARDHRVCPFELALELALWADCIICDYNYAFDPRVYLRRFFLEERGEYTFLIDEAHNLVDRSREMFSAEIYKQPLLDIRRTLRHDQPRIHKSLGKLNSWMLKARKKCEESGLSRADKEPPQDLFPILRQFMQITESWLSLNLKTAYRETLLELFFSISGFLKVADQYDNSYATCYEKIRTDVKLKLFCVDPSPHLEQALKRCSAAVFFSATMTPITYFKTILGCREEADQLILPSPFPRENLGTFVSDRVSTLYRHRSRTKTEVLNSILSLIDPINGNYLLFFPSYFCP